MQKQFTTGLVVVIAIVSTALLVGQLFDTTWAGGEGYAKQGVARVDDAIYQRGETIETKEDQWLVVHMEGVTVWMYENTELKLINLVDNRIELTVIQGRVVIDGDVTMRVRDETTELSGRYSYVHYSWLNQVDIDQIDSSFDASQSEAGDFYQWAKEETLADTAE